MELKELRIGNLVSAKDARHVFSITYNYMEEVRYWKVVGLEDDWGVTVVNADTQASVSIANRSVRHQQGSSQFEGIPLTPELLEKAGFVNCGMIKRMWRKAILSGQQSTLSIYIVDCADNNTWIDIDEIESPMFKIKHLHQLQNLIFALTGQEIEITL